MRLPLFLTIVLGFTGLYSLSAQVSMVSETNKQMSFGIRPGFTIAFPNTDQKLVDDVWADFVKNNFGGKLKKGKKGEKSAIGLRSPSVSAGEFSL